MQLDPLDLIAAKGFEGYTVRKDLVRRFKGQYPVPTYVAEFLLGRYCASINEAEIMEGLEIVQRQLESRTVRAGEEELFKARAKGQGRVKIIDIITARLDAKNDCFLAQLPSLQLNDVRIPEDLVKTHERMLTGGFYAEIDLSYDPTIAEEKNGRPFGIESLREIQLSKRDVLDTLAEGRALFTFEEWKHFLLRSIGLEPAALTERTRDVMLLRMVPFVENNYNAVELGPRGTGKSHLFQQVSPYAHLVSGGKASVARMFVNNSTGQRGLVCQYDVVCFDEVSGISFDQKDGVNIMKGYMESGEFSRGKESIRGFGGIIMVGNFDVDVSHQQRIGHLLGPMPPEMRDDTAFMDRIHSYIPGWDIPKVNKEQLTDHFGLVSDFLSSCWNHLRVQSRVQKIQGRIQFGGALSGRDTNAVQKTMSGLLKLMFPDSKTEIPDDAIEWAARLALECRRRIKEQQKRIGSAEFRNTHFSFVMQPDGVEQFVSTPELQSEDSIGDDPLPPGQVWVISPGGMDENPGLFRIECNGGPGSGVKILNQPPPGPLKESVRCAEQNLYAHAKSLVGDRDPRSHEYTLQVRAFDASKSGASTGVGVLLALCSALLEKYFKGGMVIVGGLNLGGSIEPIYNAFGVVEAAADKGCKTILMPVTTRKQLFELPDEIATRVTIIFYSDARDALLKALND
ncbi:MAG: BREX system Lon protease-like protein BrxL [Verrucomicrobia bacterium]|nr:BREX system Lon protease-like protein BrxL [Verrucomicrobiota bacterium]